MKKLILLFLFYITTSGPSKSKDVEMTSWYNKSGDLVLKYSNKDGDKTLVFCSVSK